MFVLKTNENEFVGIDESSGGYPWFPKTLQGAKLFSTIEEADKYRKASNNWNGYTLGQPWYIYPVIVGERIS